MRASKKSPIPFSSRQKQAGFTLVEMLIAMGIATTMLLVMSKALGPALSFFSKQETASRLQSMRSSLEAAYRDESARINAETLTRLTTASGSISPALPNATGVCSANSTTFAPISRYLPTSVGESWRDGHGQALCVFVTAQQTATLNGVTFAYHSIAVVSPGNDGAMDAATALSDTGTLTLGGDDKGIVVDGRRLVASQIESAQAQLQRIGDAYASYFTTRYQASPSRDPSTNYFANANKAGAASAQFDAAGSMPTTGGVAVAMTLIGAHTVLGLAVNDVTDPWGQVYLIDNSTDAVRHPQNATAALTTPAYTARISTPIPGTGGSLNRTVVGVY